MATERFQADYQTDSQSNHQSDARSNPKAKPPVFCFLACWRMDEGGECRLVVHVGSSLGSSSCRTQVEVVGSSLLSPPLPILFAVTEASIHQ